MKKRVIQILGETSILASSMKIESTLPGTVASFLHVPTDRMAVKNIYLKKFW